MASSLDDTIRLMDRANGGLLNAYKGHKNHQYKIRSCLSNSDAHVISGSEDGKIYMWDLIEVGSCSREFQSSIAGINDLQLLLLYSPSGLLCACAEIERGCPQDRRALQAGVVCGIPPKGGQDVLGQYRWLYQNLGNFARRRSMEIKEALTCT